MPAGTSGRSIRKMIWPTAKPAFLHAILTFVPFETVIPAGEKLPIRFCSAQQTKRW
jgi:lipopolysaccharide export LptBFGC system permease protein LptF